MTKKILVTGATGFIGSALTRRLVAQGADVRILRLPGTSLDLLGNTADRVTQVLGDVTDPESLGPAMDGVAQVYHVASYLGQDQTLLHRVNVVGTGHVVNAALKAGVTRLVYTSSVAALGRPEHEETVIAEDAVWHTSRYNTPYAHSKHLAELEIQRGVAEGLDAVIVNPTHVFGPGRSHEGTFQLVEKIRQGKLRVVPVGGTNVVDVDDVVEGHLQAMTLGTTGERYILGSENLSWKTIFEMLAKAFGVPPPQRTIAPGTALTLGTLFEAVAFFTRKRPMLSRERALQSSRRYLSDNRKAVEELGCTFQPFAETARKLADL